MPNHMRAVAIRLAPVLLALTWSSVGAVSYSFEELERGVPVSSAVSSEQAAGNKVLRNVDLGGYTVQRPTDNKLVAILKSCDDRIFGYTTEAVGGSVGFIKRVAQFNAMLGPGSVSASSRMVSVGEVSTIKVVWSVGQGRSVTLEFTPETASVAESQWVAYSVAKVCNK